MDRVNEAVSCFKEGFSCSQAVLSAFSEDFGLDRDIALKIATAFGGGMARMGKTCGAVTGAFMVIGLKYGRTKTEDEKTQNKAYALVQEFVKRFESQNGSIECKELLGYDISIPEELEKVNKENICEKICPPFVQNAVEILEQIL